MKLKVLATGSSGNCYILTSGTGEFLVLDAGIKFKDITSDKAFTGFKNLDLAFVSHEHKDHSLSLQRFKDVGVTTISYESGLSSQGADLGRLGRFLVEKFAVNHNVPTFGAIIRDLETRESVVYATDFSAMPKIFGVKNFIYEINFDQESYENAVWEDKISLTHASNSYNNHNSLEKAVDYFEQIGKIDNLVIVHMGSETANEDKIRKTMQKYANNVYIAKKGKEIQF